MAVATVRLRILFWGVLAAAFAVSGQARADDFLQSSPGPLSASHAAFDGQDNCTQCHTDGKNLSNEKCLGCHDHADQKAKIIAGKGFHSTSKVAGRDCWTCHLEHKGKTYDLMGWAAVGNRNQFNHDLTDFKLNGKHAATGCDDCHKRSNSQGLRVYLGEQKVCGACHQKDQPHNVVRAELLKCDRCHTEVSWKPPKKTQDFDHNDKTQASFPLEGTHLDVACAKCHPKSEFRLKKDTSQCSACHDNPHVGHLYGEKKCTLCHSPTFGTLAKYKFDHDRQTKFKLDGKHAKIDCYSCHPKNVKTKPSPACEGCHARDSKHKDRFNAFGNPPKCGTCHPSSIWKPTLFNHDRNTKFKLTGKHAFAQCRDCHRGKDPSDWERFDAKTIGCMGCHKHANVHEKQYKDAQCLTCHKMAGSMEDAGGAKDAFHGPGSKFPLTEAHNKVPCAKCHPNDKWKGVSVECGPACHADTLHRGTLGDTCSRCHSGGVWKAREFNHNEDSDYKLRGLHKKVDCAACHPNRVYKPTPTSCGASGCHQQDDAHNKKLGRKCETCHKETGENVFKHNVQAQFKLEDAHLKVACKACHPTMEFRPRPKDCFGCHPEPEVHKGQYGTLCAGCHDQVAWQRIKPIHDVGNFSLTGAHNGIDCRRCHKDSRPLAGTGTLCLTCHRQDDIHGNSLGPQCGQCHTQTSFSPARFDHTTVGCDLQGQHRLVPCADCHKSGAYGTLSTDCYACHRVDALNSGVVTPDHKTITGCGSCHSVNTFAGASPAGGGIANGTNSVCR